MPISDLLTHKSVSKWLVFLDKSQNWSREQIDNYQNMKLQELIQHAYKNVPFYKELFLDLKIQPSEIKTKEDLKKLPVITKDDLRRSKDKRFANNIDKSSRIYASSSGSTGEPFQYYKTNLSESVLKAAAIRGWSWMDYHLGDPYVKVSMNPRGSVIKKIQDYLNNSMYLSSKQLSQVEFSRIEQSIHNFNPKFIRCYPVPLYFLANQIEMKKGRYTGSSLKAINTTGSTLNKEIRDKIEHVFGVSVFDSYSCEGGAVFFECNTHDNYHPSEEYAIQEYLEDGFTLSDPEKPFRHITTDLHNYASPFIRYDTQDYIVLGDNNTCSCGRHFRNIKKIRGRDSDILRTPSGKYLIVENFVAYFEWIKEVEQIQVIQEDTDLIIIKLLVNSDFNNNIYNKIQAYWSNYIGFDVRLLLEVVDRIDLTSTGKRRTLIRNSQIKLDDRY